MEILSVEKLNFTYPLSSSPTLKDISFNIKKGDFTVLCGPTGCGKSTLLKMLKPEISPTGNVSGNIFYKGQLLCETNCRTSASEIGYVMQKPELQVVTDRVWHEIAFGLENTGINPKEIARRSAEISSYFGITEWYDKPTSELSGGQIQLMNLASVLIMNPEILILDEPSAQLDPIASADFITALKRLNDDFSITIIITEHRLEDVIPVCDRLIIMENGSITADGKPVDVINSVRNNRRIMSCMPAPSRIFAEFETQGNCPLTVREGRKYIENTFTNDTDSILPEKKSIFDEKAVEFSDVYFRYEKNSHDILKGINLSVYKNEIFCLLGSNGSGKSTTLLAASGLLKIYSGNININGKKITKYKNQGLYKNCLAMLPQDVQTLFLKNTIAEELSECGFNPEEFPFDISSFMDRHPYDLSGGEQQIAALAKVLTSNPQILLLDEPTKGLDALSRKIFINILKSLKEKGITVIIVTHDIEFAAECADRCALLFNGTVVSEGETSEFFSENTFYTTAVCRMTKGYFKNTVTVEDTVRLCKKNARKDRTEYADN